jgi:2-iminobutanoate/2-iminopropanoate deaminase
MRRIIASPHAPKAIGPYSQAVVTRHVPGVEHLHAAGQIPIDPATGELVGADTAAQTERVLENVAAVLAHAGMEFADVVKTTVYLVDLADFAAMNQAYERRFSGDFPARSTIQVAALPRGARVEIEVHAVKHPVAGPPPRAAPRKAAARGAAPGARKAAPKGKAAAKGRAARPARGRRRQGSK